MIWHVDDLKVSHEKEEVVTSFLKWLEEQYGELQTTRGKTHSSLEMKLDYSKKGKMTVGMVSYVRETISEFPQQITGMAANPAGDHLFEVNSE